MGGYIGARAGSVGATLANIQDVTATDTSPEVTLVNNTHEDTDGGREGKVIFKGQQSGGEESTLAEIQASHDGTADDEKGDLIFRTNDGSDGASPTERMRIDSDGNIGIGVASADCDLHINGATNSEQVIITGGNNASRGLSISTVANGGQSDAGVIFNAQDTENSSYPALIHQTGGSERMRIDGNGNVGIGTNSPSVPLHVKKASGANYIAEFQNTTSGSPYGLAVRDASGGSNGYPLFQVTNNAGSVNWFRVNSGNGYVMSTGIYNQSAADSANVVVDSTGNVYRSTSALKYKQDIRDIESIDIDRFRPIRYKSNLEKDDNTKDHFGFIADEVHDDGLSELVAYGVNPETEETEVEGFRYDRMTVILTKVVQEQKATIETQATQIADLIKRVEALEAE